MDADAYPEASREVLKIVWGIGCSLQTDHNLQWAKAKASAFEAITKYEVLVTGTFFFSDAFFFVSLLSLCHFL